MKSNWNSERIMAVLLLVVMLVAAVVGYALGLIGF